MDGVSLCVLVCMVLEKFLHLGISRLSTYIALMDYITLCHTVDRKALDIYVNFDDMSNKQCLWPVIPVQGLFNKHNVNWCR